jgi:hypothetical protein
MRMISSLIVCISLLAGCGINPAGPATLNPYKTLQDAIVGLDTPLKVSEWLSRYTTYQETCTAWYTTDDNAKALAEELFRNKGGKCGNFAGFYVYVLRQHGYDVGGIIYITGNDTAHIETWIKKNGSKISLTSNQWLTPDLYNSFAEFVHEYSVKDIYTYCDDKLNFLTNH